MAAMDKATIEKAKSENPGVQLGLVKVPERGKEYLFKTPDDPEWRSFRKDQEDDAGGIVALRSLLLRHVVVPPAAELAAELDREPGLTETLGKPVIKLAGAGLAATLEKI